MSGFTKQGPRNDTPYTPTAGVGRRRAGDLSWYQRRQLTGVLCVLPAALFITLFFFIPLVLAFWMSLYRWPLLGIHKFIGVANYVAAFHDSTFLHAAGFTAEYTLIITPILLIVGLILALLVKGSRRGTGFFRTVYFLPVPIGFASASFLWVWLVQPDVGPFGRILQMMHLVAQPPQWLAATASALFVVIAMVTWKTSGMQMILLMSGMQAIPTELEEAARVDGAGRWQVFFHITLPLLRPTLALVLVFSVAGSLLAFDQFYIITGGGPSNSTITAVYWIYHTSFVTFQLGYGSALSILLMLVLAAVSFVQLRLIHRSTEF